MADIPYDLFYIILDYCDIQSILRCRLLNKAVLEIADKTLIIHKARLTQILDSIVACRTYITLNKCMISNVIDLQCKTMSYPESYPNRLIIYRPEYKYIAVMKMISDMEHEKRLIVIGDHKHIVKIMRSDNTISNGYITEFYYIDNYIYVKCSINDTGVVDTYNSRNILYKYLLLDALLAYNKHDTRLINYIKNMRLSPLHQNVYKRALYQIQDLLEPLIN